VQNDVAAAWFVRRGHNTFWHEIHTLARRGGVWSCLGGGGHNADEDGLADRPCAAELGGLLVSRGGGSTSVGQRSLLPLPDRFVTYAELLVAEEVSAVEVGSDHRAAPRHGRLLAVWTERPPRVRALAADGDELATLDLASGPDGSEARSVVEAQTRTQGGIAGAAGRERGRRQERASRAGPA